MPTFPRTIQIPTKGCLMNIPIKAAKELALKYDLDEVVIIAKRYDKDNPTTKPSGRLRNHASLQQMPALASLILLMVHKTLIP